MRPHHLRVTAFGPFPQTQEVDLDHLGASGLFLLHGETGAGKTTLLDALGFALYGRVPGARGSAGPARRLRSDHAGAAERTEVRLEATLAGRRIRVTRSPDQQRPKLRGRGTTSEPARVLLEEWAGDAWREVSRRVGEADAEIADLMGMSAEQFFQVVLLPQGEFARFLRAGSAERATLLERLFGTDRFRDAEQWLAEQRRVSTRRVESAREGLGRLVARVAQVADVDAPDDDPPASWAPGLAGQAADDAARAAVAADAHRRSLDAAQRVLRETEQRAERQRRRAAALDRRATLASQAAEVEQARAELEAAARAAEVAAVLDEAARLASDRERAEEAARRARAEVVPLGFGADAAVETLRTAAEERQQQVGRLEQLRELADRAAAEDDAAAAARDRAGRDAADGDACAAAIDRLSERRRALLSEREAVREAATRLPQVRADADRTRAAATDARALASARAEADRHTEAHTAARETALRLREHAQSLREQRFDAMVAELVASLEDETPCPVCGSLDHPEPSDVRGARVTREQEDAASAEADAAQAVVEDHARRLAAARARADDLAARLEAAGAAGRAADVLDEEAAARAGEVESLGRTAAQGEAVDASLTALDGEVTDSEKRRARLAAGRDAALREADAAVARAEAARADLRDQLGGAPDLDTAVAAETRAAGTLDTAADAATAAGVAVTEAARAATAAERAAGEAGFANAAAAGAARRQPAWRERTQARVDRHREDAASAEGALADPDLDVPLDPPADVSGTSAAVDDARAAWTASLAAQERVRGRADQLADLAPEVTAALDGLTPLVARADEVRGLADLVSGTGAANTLRMALSSFVLAARLEEVAASASERLVRMTQGRYTLVHTDAGRGGGKAGLGLLVRDAWTGQDRDTGTLSGGETFLASLSLALGLADVVTAEAGGARLEALFVDEGFGTLDEDTLDEVMDILDGLREGGRLVGVVSHVPELRARIPAQVRVRKTRTGSDVVVTAA